MRLVSVANRWENAVRNVIDARCGRKVYAPRLGALSVSPIGNRFVYYVHFFHFISSVCNLRSGFTYVIIIIIVIA